MKKSGSSKKKAVKRNKDEKKQALDEKAEQVGVLEHAAYLQRLIWEQTASTSVRRSIRREDNDSDTDRPECMQSRRAPRDEPNRRASGRREDPQQQPQDFVSTRPTISSPPEDEGDSYFARPGAFAVSGELRGSDSNDQGSGADSSPDADANNDLEVEEQEEDDFEALLLATFKEGENEDAEDGQVASDRARLLQRLREQQGRIRELETEAQRIPELESRVQQQREMQENSGEGGPGAIVRASLVEEPVTVQAILVETESESRARQRHFADATHVEVDRQNVLVTDDGSDSEDTKSFLVSLCCQNRRRVILSLVILLVALVLLGAVGALLSKSGGNVGNTMVPSVAPSPQPIETTPTVPTVQPIWPPTVARTTSPTSEPTTHRASPIPTLRTTNAPNQRPATGQPIKASPAPSPAPTAFSVPAKTQPPVFMPDNEPTVPPFSQTTHSPSETLTHSPSSFPTRAPTQNPTKHLSPAPTNRPTLSPSRSPTSSPTRAPTDLPSPFPTLPPVLPPSRSPTRSPTQSPTKSATRLPTRLPTRSPTRSPISPTRSPLPPPTRSPTDAPTRNDSDTPFPTVIGGDIPQGNPPVPFPSPVVRPPTIGTDEWQKVGQDLVGEAAGDSFGRSVALSADGTILAAGGEENDANGLSSGHVRVFLYHKFSRRWEQLGQDINGEAAGDEFGRTVALSADGTTVAAGARYNEGKGVAAGHVRVFRYHSASKQWKRLGQVLEAIHRNDRFGDAVSLSGDGRILAASATWHSFMRNGDQSGQVRMYRFNSAANRWEPFGNFVNGQSRFDKFGDSVAINAQGSRNFGVCFALAYYYSCAHHFWFVSNYRHHLCGGGQQLRHRQGEGCGTYPGLWLPSSHQRLAAAGSRYWR